MERISTNAESPKRDFGDRLQLTNWVLYSGATFHMTLDISYCVTVSLVETDKHIEVAYGHFITVKQTGEAQIKMSDNNRQPLTATLYNVLLTPDLCNQLFSNILLMNSGHAYYFHQGSCMVFISDNEHKLVTSMNSAQRQHVF